MKSQREMLESLKAGHTENAARLRSYVKELSETAARLGTDTALLDADLLKAHNDIDFHEAEARLMDEMIAGDGDHTAFWVYADASGEWRWRLRAGNERIIADSGEGYRNKQDCLHAIALVKASKEAPIREKDKD